MSVKNPHIACLICTQNRSIFLFIERSTAWLNDCPHHLSPLYNAEQCYGKVYINYLANIMYLDAITRQGFKYAHHIPCDDNPQNVFALDILLIVVLRFYVLF